MLTCWSMLDILKQYLSGIVHYWWLLIIGLLGAVNSVYKWFHPDRKDFPIPHWLRIYSAIGALILAQFLIYRDSIYNLNTVILQKQSYASENWHLRQDLSTGSRSQAIRPLQSKGTSILSASSQSTAKNQSTPTSISTQPQIIAPSATQTPFESLIQVNKNFPTGDRERLSNALYDYSQEL